MKKTKDERSEQPCSVPKYINEVKAAQFKPIGKWLLALVQLIEGQQLRVD